MTQHGVEECWARVEAHVVSHCLRHGEDDKAALAAVLALVLVAFDRGWYAADGDYDHEHARLEAMGRPAEAGKEDE